MKSFTSEIFGKYHNQEIRKITLTNDLGFELSILTFGAIIQSIKLPKSFDNRQLVLGFDDFNAYISENYRSSYPYFGALIGRHAGRIRHGKTSIQGKEVRLHVNNGENHLHGGNLGFDSRIWDIDQIDDSHVTLSLLSEDGDENYPGNLTVYVRYELTEDNKVIITYKAKTDQPTLVNLTQHSYFNLDQSTPSILEDEILLNANHYLEMNEEVLPTGKILETKNSIFDFENFKQIPSQIDHSFIINRNDKPAAIFRNKNNTVRMEVVTDQPIIHIYSGYYIPEIEASPRMKPQANAGVAFETQGYLDADNHKEFPSNILSPEEEYNHQTIFNFKF